MSVPNVLFIAIDDLNDAPGFMGRNPDCRTPNLDGLAARGVAFRNAHCTYPLCAPSRASLLSGLRATTLGIQDLLDANTVKTRVNAAGGVLLHEHFRTNGYQVLSAGKVFHPSGVPTGTADQTGPGGSPGAKQGLNYDAAGTATDWGVPPGMTNDADVADHAIADWAAARLGEPQAKPFLLMVGFHRPHVPWYVPKPWFDLYPNPLALTLPRFPAGELDDLSAFARNIGIAPQYPRTTWAATADTESDGIPEWSEILQAYYACVSYVDHQVGRVLAALAASPHASNTIVCLWSDHGYHLGEKDTFQKHTLWERSTHTPLIFAGPGVTTTQACDRVVSLLDVYPTLVELCGLPENDRGEGRSLTPLLANPARAWPYPAVISMQGNNHAVQTETNKYILYEDGSEELYDLSVDPHEEANLAADPATAALRATLRRHLPLNLTSPAFPLRFDKSGDAQAYAAGLLTNGHVMAYGQTVTSAAARVEGMRVASTVSGASVELGLTPASAFGQWRAERFSGRDLRELDRSGAAGDADGGVYPNLLDYALALSPTVADPTIPPEFGVSGAGSAPVFRFDYDPWRKDVNLLLRATADLVVPSWEDVLTIEGGGAPVATNGVAVLSLTGDDPVHVALRAADPDTMPPVSFYRWQAELRDDVTPFFTPIEDFQSLTPGLLDGRSGWTAPDPDGAGPAEGARVGTDPADADNTVLILDEPHERAFLAVGPIPEGGTGTLFMRYRLENLDRNAAVSSENAAFGGVSDTNVPDAFADYEVQFGVNPALTTPFLYNNGSVPTKVFDQQLESDVWYCLWAVIDNAADTYALYIRGGGFETQTRLTANGGTETFPFRNGVASNALPTVFLRAGLNNTVAAYYDDIHLDVGTVNLDLPPALTAPSDIVRAPTFTEPSELPYQAYQSDDITGAGDSIEVARFTIRDGGGNADADTLATTLTALTLSVQNGQYLRRAALYDGATEIAEVAGGSTLTFAGLSGLTAPDNGVKEFSVRATFNAAALRKQLRFTVTGATADAGGSLFGSPTAGGASSDTTGTRNMLNSTYHYVWQGGTDTDWNNAANWLDGAVAPTNSRGLLTDPAQNGGSLTLAFEGAGSDPAANVPQLSASYPTPQNPNLAVLSGAQVAFTVENDYEGPFGSNTYTVAAGGRLTVGTARGDGRLVWARGGLGAQGNFFNIAGTFVMDATVQRVDFSTFIDRWSTWTLDGGTVTLQAGSGTLYGTSDANGDIATPSTVILDNGATFDAPNHTFAGNLLENNGAGPDATVVFDLRDAASRVVFKKGGYFPDLAAVSNAFGKVFVSTTLGDILTATEAGAVITVSP